VAGFCLIHGAWHGAASWQWLAPELAARGHEVVAPELPLHDPRATFAERIEPAVASLEGLAGPIVVVGHSMGSAYAALVAVARPGSRLVYLCPRLGGLPVPPGAPRPFRDGFPFPTDRPDGTSAWEPDAALVAMYGRLEPEAAHKLVQSLRPMAQPPDAYPLHDHPDVPTALIYAADDEFFEPAWPRFMASELLGIEPIEIPGGHFPMAEEPELLADFLDRLAAER
jgi:pimeloyl-ACP methyl ester carboxylesterase